MKVSKRFRWEAAHRLPWHDGLCRNLHGHSYAMWVELEGVPNERGMLIDFKEIKRAVAPLVEQWDHAILLARADAALLKIAQEADWKHFILPYDTTAENMCRYVAEHVAESASEVLSAHAIHTLRVRISETETCCAEFEKVIQ